MTRPTVIDTWETADRRQDLAVMRSLLASEVRLISPLTDAFAFEGPDEVMAVFESAFELLDDITIHKVTGAGPCMARRPWAATTWRRSSGCTSTTRAGSTR